MNKHAFARAGTAARTAGCDPEAHLPPLQLRGSCSVGGKAVRGHAVEWYHPLPAELPGLSHSAPASHSVGSYTMSNLYYTWSTKCTVTLLYYTWAFILDIPDAFPGYRGNMFVNGLLKPCQCDEASQGKTMCSAFSRISSSRPV